MGACYSSPYDDESQSAYSNTILNANLTLAPYRLNHSILAAPSDYRRPGPNTFDIPRMIVFHQVFMEAAAVDQFMRDKFELAEDPTYKTQEMIRVESGNKYENIRLIHTDTPEYMASNPSVLHYAIQDSDGNPINLTYPRPEEFIYIRHKCDDIANTSADILCKVFTLPNATTYTGPKLSGVGIISLEIRKHKADPHFLFNNAAVVSIVFNAEPSKTDLKNSKIIDNTCQDDPARLEC